MLSNARRLFQQLIDLMYPPMCGGCGRVDENWWCAKCDAATLRWMPEQQRRDYPVQDNLTLGVFSAVHYASPIQEAIHQFKYEATPHLHKPLAQLMREMWRDAEMPFSKGSLLVPVPLHRSRMRERGYNHSEMLAQQLAPHFAVELRPDALTRARATQQQARLNMQQRYENVAGAFVADLAIVRHKDIVLLDDVCTTGATLRECARVMYAADAKSVVAWTLARGEMKTQT